MRRAIARLGGHDHVIVDGNRIVGFEALVGPYSNVVDGDAKVYSVACASVVAKVVRDRMMIRLAARYPGYGWEHNQGYATRDHRDAIRRLGLTPFHRRSFLALQRTLAGDQLAFDLLADPNASAEAVEILDREAIPVMADDAMLDLPDLVRAGACDRMKPAIPAVKARSSPCPGADSDATGRRRGREARSRIAWRRPAGPSSPASCMSAGPRSMSSRSIPGRRASW